MCIILKVSRVDLKMVNWWLTDPFIWDSSDGQLVLKKKYYLSHPYTLQKLPFQTILWTMLHSCWTKFYITIKKCLNHLKIPWWWFHCCVVSMAIVTLELSWGCGGGGGLRSKPQRKLRSLWEALFTKTNNSSHVFFWTLPEPHSCPRLKPVLRVHMIYGSTFAIYKDQRVTESHISRTPETIGRDNCCIIGLLLVLVRTPGVACASNAMC